MGFNEADTRAKLINPALYRRGWSEANIRREETPGGIDVVNQKARRRSKGRMDYVLRLIVRSDTQPVAVALIEAKQEDALPTEGLQQGIDYAACMLHNIPFVYSTNGHRFVEYDGSTGITSAPKPMSAFPAPHELRQRYEAMMGFSLDDEAAKPLLTKYSTGEDTRRYYQDAAIRAALEKIARCERQSEPARVLLSLATGAGKTFIAVNLLKRVADAGLLKRALFVCDRDELRTQAAGAFQNLFGADAAMVSARQPQKNAKILIATYQTLDVDGDEDDANFLTTHYPEDYFSHIVIDECHRSAWGKWSQVLTRNPGAVQVGLTATPRQLDIPEDSDESRRDQQITADNLRYFGEPVYEYSIGQGMEDGYLAACQLQRSRVNLDETGITKEEILAHNPIDAKTGLPITEADLDDLYANTSFEDRLMLPDRVIAMGADLFRYLLETGGPEQKTIIFCVRDNHAQAITIEMNNLYARWCAEHGREPVRNYAFRCTAKGGGKDFLADLKGSNRDYFIATTVDLLTTGVDVPSLRNVAFFKYMKSPIMFYQMVGRGTRIDINTNKLMFWLYDYTNATRLFGHEFRTQVAKPSTAGEGEGTYDAPPIIQVAGFDVQIRDDGQYILTVINGRETPVTVQQYQEMLAERLLNEVPTPNEFLERWVTPEERQDMLRQLHSGSLSSSVIQLIRHMEDYDLYDVLVELGYQLPPKTRFGRVESFMLNHDGWLNGMPQPAADTVRQIAAQFTDAGTDGLESRELFASPKVRNAGGIKALKLLGDAKAVLMDMKRRLFAA